MVASQHTPGPWVAQRSGNCAPSFEVRTEHGELLVGGANLSQSEANAHLIAAAPDLLKAAIQAAVVIDILWVSHHANRSDAALEALSNAISKATAA